MSALVDLKLFLRNVSLKLLFKNSVSSQLSCKRRSIFIPMNLPVITAFYDLCEREPRCLYSEVPRKNYNLSYSEFVALKDLQNNSSIVIKQADKGGGGCN